MRCTSKRDIHKVRGNHINHPTTTATPFRDIDIQTFTTRRACAPPITSSVFALSATQNRIAHHGIHGDNNQRRGHHQTVENKIPLAGRTAEFLAVDYDSRQRDGARDLCEFHDNTNAAAAWNALVSFTLSDIYASVVKPVLLCRLLSLMFGDLLTCFGIRYFPYWVSVGSLTLAFILIMLWLISQRQLLPGIVIMGSFICFILWMVGLIVISVQLWGPSGSVNGNCNIYVMSDQQKGASIETLAWLQQRSIC